MAIPDPPPSLVTAELYHPYWLPGGVTQYSVQPLVPGIAH